MRADPPGADGTSSQVDDSETSQGVLVSTDGGESWSQAAAGLEVDGIAYRAVDNLVVSPAYTQDHTLMAFALGPKAPCQSSCGFSVYGWALFRSTDGATTWQTVWTGAGYPDRASRNALVISPAFSQDATVLRTVTEGLLVGRPSGCTVRISRDAGTTWSDVDARWVDMYWSCGSPVLVAAIVDAAWGVPA